jgi:hypothetical protein
MFLASPPWVQHRQNTAPEAAGQDPYSFPILRQIPGPANVPAITTEGLQIDAVLVVFKAPLTEAML